MQTLVFRSTKFDSHTLLNLKELAAVGSAYRDGDRLVHVGRVSDWAGAAFIAFVEDTSMPLEDWIKHRFGATDIETSDHLAGHSIRSVWRPGMSEHSQGEEALGTPDFEMRLAEQALFLLIARLDEILNFIEPAEETLDTYGHKARELLILACTEVENTWKACIRESAAGLSPDQRLTTNDYVKLLPKLYLAEYEISMPRYDTLSPMRPFKTWDINRPTKSLPWYDAYNLTKHDRTANFNVATVRHCLNAVAANVALFTARYGFSRLTTGRGTLATLFTALFAISVVDVRAPTVFTPRPKLPASVLGGSGWFTLTEIHPWIVEPLDL
jgi:hypothetical protein